MKAPFYHLVRIVFLLFLIAFSAGACQAQQRTNAFITQLDSIRTALQIPGMAVAIAKDDSILVSTGLGFSDIKNKIPVSPTTTFRVASISKTFASTIIGQLVEKGSLDLDTPVSSFGLDFGNPHITVRHLITHTSEGEPGRYYQYNGYRFSFLQKVIEQVTGIPYYQLLMERIVQVTGMSATAPGISLFNYYQYRQSHPAMMHFFDTAFNHLAKPYDINRGGDIIESTYFDEFGTSGGITSNVIDLLKYSVAIDKNQFVTKATQQQIFTPNRSSNGEVTPYALGWFSQSINGIEIYWHYGQTQGESGLFVKVPSRGLTLAVLTNSIRLSSPFPLGDGDLLSSPVGQLFYRSFIQPDQKTSLFGKDLQNKEMIAQASIDNVKGDTSAARKLYALYREMNFAKKKTVPAHAAIASISNVGTNQELTKTFRIKKTSKLVVIGVGENCSTDFTSWCDYGWIDNANKKMVWQMQGQAAKPAGGAKKNQKVQTTITLPPGTYTLHYKSDWAHAYDSWDSLPPDNFEWGIALYSDTER